MSLTKLSLIKSFPARESLIGDLPAAGDGKTVNLFYSVETLYVLITFICSFDFKLQVKFGLRAIWDREPALYRNNYLLLFLSSMPFEGTIWTNWNGPKLCY
jgi:hypothetical protein